ncbi:MAG: hypothetical protein ACO1OX_06820 [Novosphingobium sp.]
MSASIRRPVVTIADLRKGGLDAGENLIIRFQVKRPPEFAVYYSDERVVVSFADDPALAAKQRGDLAQIAPVRGEINGLLDDWRSAEPRPNLLLTNKYLENQARKKRAMAERFDQRVADALVVALNGDITGAGAVLEDIKQDIMAHRAGIARLQSLAAAAVGVLGFIVLAGLFGDVAKDSCNAGFSAICFPDGAELWRGALTGAVGALFSLALGIRRREVQPDFNFASNVTEALLRILIGAIAGTVLVGLIRSGFVHIGFGGVDPKNTSPLYYAAAGFLAGFAERLVPDLLAKGTVADGAASPPLRQPAPQRELKVPGGDGPDATKRGGSLPGGGSAGAQAAEAIDHAPDQSREDGCVCDHDLAEDEITDDAFLPVASGGVEPAPATNASGAEVRP